MGSHKLKDIMNYVYCVDTHFLLNIDILQDMNHNDQSYQQCNINITPHALLSEYLGR